MNSVECMYVCVQDFKCVYTCMYCTVCMYICRNKSSMIAFLSCYRDNMYVCTMYVPYIHTYIIYIIELVCMCAVPRKKKCMNPNLFACSLQSALQNSWRKP